MKRVLVTGDFTIEKSLIPENIEIIQLRTPRCNQDICHALKDVHAYIIGGPEYASKEIIDAGPLLQQIIVMGTGTSSFVDQEYAKSKGISVSNTPSINADAVAEFTVAMIVNALANLYESTRGVYFGTDWLQRPRLSLKNAKIGIIGMGNIGTELTNKLTLLGANNLYYFSRSMKSADINATYLPLEELLKTVDVVCLHLTYNESSHHLLNEENLALANPSLKILNLSNPYIINANALKSFLKANRESFCFFDGYYHEWVQNEGASNDPKGLLEMGSAKFIASSHIAAQEISAVADIFKRAIEIIKLM